MRKTLNILTLLILTITVTTAQGFGGGQEFGSGKKYDPVKWFGEVEKISDTEYILHYDAKIKATWHVYSQFTPEDGPIPLHFEFLPENDATYKLDGVAKESETHREYSEIFEVDEVFWENKARLSQKIKLTDIATPFIKSIVKHQSCIENGVCINQEFYVVHDLIKNSVKSFTNYTAFEAYGEATKRGDEIKSQDVVFNGTSNFGGDQKYDPVKWSGNIEKTSNTEYVLNFNAVVEDGWYIYAQDTPAGLPLKLEFIEKGKGVDLDGKVIESETKTAFDEIFEEDVIKYVGKTPKLSQKVTTELPVVKSIITYQVCKEVCIRQEFYVVHDLKEEEVKVFANYNDFESYGGIIKTDENKGPPTKVKDDQESSIEGSGEKKSYWLIFLGTLLAGLLVTFTPCVFPMIPMTISFFIKQNENKSKGKFNALFYGFCIVAIYVLISLPFHLFESLNPNIFNAISTNVYLNIFFFLVFVVFAISFLGAFEINIPNSWASKADKASSGGGLLGVFFMALTLIIVSFSCTGLEEQRF